MEFVRKAVRAIGRFAIKLESAAERCIMVLLELIENGYNPVVQESIIVIKVSTRLWLFCSNQISNAILCFRTSSENIQTDMKVLLEL